MFVHLPLYSRSTTSQRPASRTTTLGLHGRHGVQPLVLPGLGRGRLARGQRRAVAGRAASRRPRRAARPPDRRRRRSPGSRRRRAGSGTCPRRVGTESPTPSVRATESPKSSTRTGGPVDEALATVVVVAPCPSPHWPRGRWNPGRSCWPAPRCRRSPRSARPPPRRRRRARPPRPATAAGTCPCGSGRSTRWKESAATTRVTSTRRAKSG